MRILGTNLQITRRHAKAAGRSRLVAGGDFIHELDRAARLRLNLLPIAGGASAQYIQTTAAVSALTNSLVTYHGPIVGVGQAPLVLGYHHVPAVTAATAATIITINARRTDTPAIIGGQVWTTATGDTLPKGPSFPFLVPFSIPATSGVDIQGSESGAAGAILTGSVTQPILTVLLQIN